MKRPTEPPKPRLTAALTLVFRENLDKLPASYAVLTLVARLDEAEVVARIDDGSLNQKTSKRKVESFGKGNGASKHHQEPDYARGVPGKGAQSDAQPGQISLLASPGDNPETLLVKKIFSAAIDLFDCAEAGLDIDHALFSQFEGFSIEQKNALREGLRYATELDDLLGTVPDEAPE